MFVHFAESIWELSRLRHTVPELDAAARHVLDDVIAEGKGGVLISGHVGNWETLGQAIALAGYPSQRLPGHSTIRVLRRGCQVAHAARATNHLAWRQHWQGDLACSAQQSVDGVFNRSGH